MDQLCSVVKSHFKKHWKTIAYQVHVVNCKKNPKTAFLYDCGAIDINSLSKLVEDLKTEHLIDLDISILKLKDDAFIMNKKKFIEMRKPSHVVDVSGSLEKPRICEESLFEMIESIDEQLKSSSTELLTEDHWCVPTIFGHLIGYPILYWHNQMNENCLGLQDLKVFQVIFKNETLVSFSVPDEIFKNSSEVQQTIATWLESFPKHNDYQIKSFISNHPIVIL